MRMRLTYSLLLVLVLSASERSLGKRVEFGGRQDRELWWKVLELD